MQSDTLQVNFLGLADKGMVNDIRQSQLLLSLCCHKTELFLPPPLFSCKMFELPIAVQDPKYYNDLIQNKINSCVRTYVCMNLGNHSTICPPPYLAYVVRPDYNWSQYTSCLGNTAAVLVCLTREDPVHRYHVRIIQV